MAAHAAPGAPSGAEPLAAIFSREAEGAEARLAAAGAPVEAAVRVLGARPLRTVVARPALLARAQPGGRIAQPVPGEGSGSGSGRVKARARARVKAKVRDKARVRVRVRVRRRTPYRPPRGST